MHSNKCRAGLRRAWQQCRFVPVELERVFRQRDAGFVALLSNLRSGRVTSADQCARPGLPEQPRCAEVTSQFQHIEHELLAGLKGLAGLQFLSLCRQACAVCSQIQNCAWTLIQSLVLQAKTRV